MEFEASVLVITVLMPVVALGFGVVAMTIN
jgi:hypothetical protein